MPDGTVMSLTIDIMGDSSVIMVYVTIVYPLGGSRDGSVIIAVWRQRQTSSRLHNLKFGRISGWISGCNDGRIDSRIRDSVCMINKGIAKRFHGRIQLVPPWIQRVLLSLSTWMLPQINFHTILDPTMHPDANITINTTTNLIANPPTDVSRKFQ